MQIGDTLTFKAGLPAPANIQADLVAGEVGTITAVETRDGIEFINVTFPSYGEFAGVSPDLFETT